MQFLNDHEIIIAMGHFLFQMPIFFNLIQSCDIFLISQPLAPQSRYEWCVVSVRKDHVHPRPLGVSPSQAMKSSCISHYIASHSSSPMSRCLPISIQFRTRTDKFGFQKNDKDLIHKQECLINILLTTFFHQVQVKIFHFFHLNHQETVGRHIDHVELVVFLQSPPTRCQAGTKMKLSLI